MSLKNIYMVQFGTGSNINLLPLAAGQIVARLKQEKELLKDFACQEIVFRRLFPQETCENLHDVAVIGFSCFLWNLNISIQTARTVKEKFPEALVVCGGPAIPKEGELVDNFLREHGYIDILCMGEGEEVFVDICKQYGRDADYSKIPGIIFRNREKNSIEYTGPEDMLDITPLPSPYLDGTFDAIYEKYSSEFSGVVLETNRGCPYTCAFCTWGNQPFKRIRKKPIEIVEQEIKWIGQHKEKYVAMTDSNFGIRKRDVEIAGMMAECRKEYGAFAFVSVSWVKNESGKILKIAKILQNAGIGFRITLSLQSLNTEVLKAVNRINISLEDYEVVRKAYEKQQIYSYTELILGLPMETYESFLAGIDQCLRKSVYDQLYIYPCFLFPNTKLGTAETCKKYGIKSRTVIGRYTKSKEIAGVSEFVEMVIGTNTMPEEKWLDSFVICYSTLALHDNRLAFFILNYLRKEYDVVITHLMCYVRANISKDDFPVLNKAFCKLENTARGVQLDGKSHLIEPEGFNGIPFDPPEGIFLELLIEKESFYDEFLDLVCKYLTEHGHPVELDLLKDLFAFQNAVMAHPETMEREIIFSNDWIGYFSFTFDLKAVKPRSSRSTRRFKIVDPAPADGDLEKFLENHFNVRGVPAFNLLVDDQGEQHFPLVEIS
jgi:radical SAM superfamily enzyme YgiQ (UPF0313 family)